MCAVRRARQEQQRRPGSARGQREGSSPSLTLRQGCQWPRTLTWVGPRVGRRKGESVGKGKRQAVRVSGSTAAKTKGLSGLLRRPRKAKSPRSCAPGRREAAGAGRGKWLPVLVQALKNRRDRGRSSLGIQAGLPSQGGHQLRVQPEDVAGLYGRGGAAAISVLTESVYFKGAGWNTCRACSAPACRSCARTSCSIPCR